MTARRADLLLLLTTVIWGTTFAVVHQATQAFPPLTLVAIRFTLASVVLAPTLIRRGVVTLRLLGNGAILGTLLFLGFILQTQGLARTTPARAGFITGLHVVFVPILSRLLGARIAPRTIAAVLLSVAGLAILSGGHYLAGLTGSPFAKSALEASLPQMEWGDRLVFGCAFVYAFHTLGVSKLTKDLPVMALNTVQLATVAALGWIATAFVGTGLHGLGDVPWGALTYLGWICTIVPFTLMLKAQPSTSPTRASLIYSLEAVFAALFSWAWMNEVPSTAVWIGGGMMTSAVLLMESGPKVDPSDG
jgi:drug/metabolite transporter (DMT)-like permease